MNNIIPRLLLFDIDGTLIYKQRSGASSSYLCQALSIGFGRTIEKNNVMFSGGTDGSIALEVLSKYGISPKTIPDYDERIIKSFSEMPRLVQEGIDSGEYQWSCYLNVKTLLHELSFRNDVKLALLTGNHIITAEMKLQNAGIDTNLFKWGSDDKMFGAFGGSDHPVRSKLVEIARQRYVDYLGGKEVTGNDMVIIGDTPKDIQCAHDNGVPCVAVDTGPFSVDQLKSAEKVLEKGFANIQTSIDAIIEAKH